MSDRTPAERLARIKADDARIDLEEGGIHKYLLNSPVSDRRFLLGILQEVALHSVVFTDDHEVCATQLAEEQAKVAALVALVNEATAEFVRIDPHVQLSGWDPALVPSDLS